MALKENIRVEGKRDIQTKVMTTLFALFAEVERDLISERTREGLAKAKASGRKLGSPERLAGRLTARRQRGRDPALPRTRRVQDRHRQDRRRLPHHPLQLHDHQRAQAEPRTVIDTTLPTGVTPRARSSWVRARERGNVVFVTVLSVGSRPLPQTTRQGSRGGLDPGHREAAGAPPARLPRLRRAQTRRRSVGRRAPERARGDLSTSPKELTESGQVVDHNM